MTQLEAKLLQRQINPVGVIDTHQRHCHDTGQQTHTNRLMQRLKLPEQQLQRYTGGILQSGAIAQRFNVQRVEGTDWEPVETAWRIRTPETTSVSNPSVVVSAQWLTQPERVMAPTVSQISVRATSTEPLITVKAAAAGSLASLTSEQPTKLRLQSSDGLSQAPVAAPATGDIPSVFRIRRGQSHSTEAQSNTVNPAHPLPYLQSSFAHPLQISDSPPEQGIAVRSTQLSMTQNPIAAQPHPVANAILDPEPTTLLFKVKPSPVVKINYSTATPDFMATITSGRQARFSVTTAQNTLLPRIQVQPTPSPMRVGDTEMPMGSDPGQTPTQRNRAATSALPLVVPTIRWEGSDRPSNSTPLSGAPAEEFPSRAANQGAIALPSETTPAINIEKVADQVSRVLSRRLILERERRGMRP